jgi:hypothetical protein
MSATLYLLIVDDGKETCTFFHRSVDVLVSRLRPKIEVDPEDRRLSKLCAASATYFPQRPRSAAGNRDRTEVTVGATLRSPLSA